MSTPVSVPTRNASRWSCDRAKIRQQSVRAATCRHPDTTNSRNDVLSLFLCGDFSSFSCMNMRRVDCRRCGVVAVEEVPWGDGKTHLDQSVHALPSPLGPLPFVERNRGVLS